MIKNKPLLNLLPRLQREYKTVEAMISIFCKNHHESPNICDDCQELRDYAMERLQKCPFGEDKTTCIKCPVHCYRPIMREKIRKVMRYSGSRMIFMHPILTIQHLLDEKKGRARNQLKK
ncbi:MAG TPA: nitrous oxide-stimulated promoter family protein [Dehalococcoidia bacterium]|nr:nitrous oxide-stimulated promoter family protein [Dehalococcoidia bacterium]